jgi:transposase
MSGEGALMPYLTNRIRVSARDLKTLDGWTRRPTMPQQWALRARIVMASARGDGVRAIARQLNVRPATVCEWRQRYRAEGISGLRTRARTGRPRQISETRERSIVAKTLTPPRHATHWSTRTLAKETKVSPATVGRIWNKYGLQPHRTTTFKFSKDPAFEEKLTDVVGLYMDPPEKAIVLCVDEKSQIQALDRTQPLLPMLSGLPERRTHDYKRHGTTSLFAALEVASGRVLGRCFPRHTHVEFLSFLDAIDARHRRNEIHLICDNYGTHKHPAVRAWFKEHPRFKVHFTPTSASWLNLVERWFALITDQSIRRGSFTSVRALERAILRYLAHWNENAKPFRWTKSARTILRSIQRVTRIYEAGH